MTILRRKAILAAALTAALAAGCSVSPAEPTTQRVVAQPASTPAATAAPEPTAARVVPPTATPRPQPTEAPIHTPSPTATADAAATDELPAQMAASASAFLEPSQAAGDVILLTGQVLDRGGQPLPGAVVEIWQTDANGIYDHPGDSDAGRRDRAFQFYGHSVADANGVYLFRTIVPGEYEPRPRHIHVKVKRDGATLLTTQFYFLDDLTSLQGEGVFRQAGNLGNRLILQPLGVVDVAGQAAPILANDLVIDLGSGSLTPTPLQAEGPYYPVVSIADFDNDLTIAP